MRLPRTGPAITPPRPAEARGMQLAKCDECEKVWLTPATDADEERECADCGHLLTPVGDAEQTETATPRT
jgi:uncharacterized paraquat-inducible protein A